MPIFKTAYDTHMGSGMILNKTVDALQTVYMSGRLEADPDNTNIRLVKGDSSFSDSIPAFAHPLLISKGGALAVDVRPFGTWDGMQHVFKIRNQIEYNVTIHRAKLNYVWLSNQNILRDISPLGMTVYANWLSQSISRRLALDPREQMNLTIMAGIFYNSLFTEESPDEREKLRLTSALTRNLRASANDVLAILDEVSYFDGIDSFCRQTAKISGSVRLEGFNPGLLFTILGGTWFSSNAASKETVAVSTEHPPTWLSILLAAYSDRSFKNSTITKIAETNAGHSGGDAFIRSVLNMIAATNG